MLRNIWLSLCAIAIVLISGCGLRLDTGENVAEKPLTPVETLRLDMIDGVEQIRLAALRVEPGTGEQADAERLEALLANIEQKSSRQLQLLGPRSSNSSSDAPTNSQAEDENPKGDVGLTASEPDVATSDRYSLRKFDQILRDRAAAFLDATVSAEPEMARLTGSIAASTLIWSEELRALSTPDSDLDTAESDSLEPSDTAPAGTNSEHPDLPLTDLESPEPEWIPLIANWDRIGYLLEIAASRSGDQRDSYAEEANEYRSRASLWATAIGVAGGDNDPRRASYKSPALSGEFEKDVQAIQESVREEIAEVNYTLGDLLYTISPQQRPSVVRELVNLEKDNRRWGVDSPLLPGLRELGD